MKTSLIAVAGAMLLACAGLTLAQDAAPGGKGRPGAASRPHGPGGGPMEMLSKLDLTEDQKAKVKAIMDASKADLEKAETPEAKRKVFQESMEKIKAVLTAEQKTKLEEALKARMAGGPGARMLAGLDLTDDQKKQVETIMKGVHEKMQAATEPQARMEIMKAAFKEIRDKVLTADQQKKFDEMQKKMEEMRSKHQGGDAAPGAGGPRPGGKGRPAPAGDAGPQEPK